MMIFKDQFGKEHEVDPSGIEIKWRISVYGVVINEENKAVMLKPHFNSTQWQFPGGKIEVEESMDDALRREFLEEVGYKVITDNKEFLFINEQNFLDYHDITYFHSFQFIYKVVLEDDKQYEEYIERGEGMDYGEVGWVSLNSLTEKDVQHTHWPIIQMLQKKILAKPE